MNSSKGSSTSRVPIPNSMRKTILNIKEITKNHSEDDIYAMLKECSMDPNETTQRLLHLDTFHQVKSKRGKRKEVVKSRPGEDSRWKPGHQGRGTRAARGNNSSQYSSNDAGGRRSYFTRKENGVEEIREKSLRNPTAPVSKEINSVHGEKAISISINGPVNVPNGNLSCGHDSKESIGTASDSLSTIRPKGSASNPALIPLGNSGIPTIYAIQREVGNQQISTEASAYIPLDTQLGKTESTSNSHLNQSDPEIVDGSVASSSIGEKETSETANVAQPNVEKSHDLSSILAVKPSSLQGVGPLAGAEEAASKQVKLKFFDSQHVIIPAHIHVPDAVKNVLSFGTINASFGVKENYIKNENIKNLHSAGGTAPDEATEKPSSCDKDISNATQAQQKDNQQSQSLLTDVYYPVDTEDSSSATKDDQSKEDALVAVGPPFPILHTTPSYSLGFMPPMLANTLMHPEGFESQAHVSSSLSGGPPAVSTPSPTPPLTQSAGVGQATAVSPQQIPLFCQPYPPNYIPYNHYFSPFYVPPTMHQYYGHTAFPPPLPTSNVFLPPLATTAALKHSPAQYKPGANAGNQVPAGVPTGFGYSPNAAVTSGNPSTSEDLIPSALKDNNVYSRQQSEGSAFWFPPPGRNTGSFPLKFPQGHHIISPQSGHGAFAVYHTLQPMPGLPLLQHSQPVTGQVESVGPPSNAYQQSQPQINWNA